MKNIKIRGFWNYDNCKNEALKYKTRTKFSDGSIGAYESATRNGWLDKICNHMETPKKPNGYWNYNKCKEEALKYNIRTEFQKKSSGAHKFARKNNFLDDICSHMEILGNSYKRLIYAYEFSNNHVYVGLTYDIKKRDYDHNNKKNSSVYSYIKESKLKPKLIICSELIDLNDAQKLENEILIKYKENGWIVLNKTGTGALGSNNYKWSIEKCLEIAKTCKTKTEFQNKNKGAYLSAIRNKWLKEIYEKCNIFERERFNGYWNNKEVCKEEALKYKYRYEFSKSSSGAYKSALRNNWLNEFFPNKRVRYNK